MKKEKSETDNVYVCYCILREMHPGKHQAERLREVTEALWDAQTFYEKMGALMFGQAFVYGSREGIVRPFTVYEEGLRETPEEFATAYSISGTLLHCYDLLNDFMPGEEEQIVEAAEISNEMYRLVIISDYAPEGNNQALEILTRSFNELKHKCDFKICYVNTEDALCVGNLGKMVDVCGLE